MITHPKTRERQKHMAGRQGCTHNHRGAPAAARTSPTPRQSPALPRPRTKASDTPTAETPALTWPQTAPGPGRLSVPAAGTASLPSSACPGLGARRQQGRLPPESPRRAAPAAPALWRLRCCSADGNSCSHQWQRKQEHFGSFSPLNCCQFWRWVAVWFWDWFFFGGFVFLSG